ncbi:hypothetical protein QYF61_019202 [Mycteria americana]|uniref:Uncharacterized protein n=1 Tax=Mycteria americana TaxID=33587 RepID=A0AAN7SAS4_MYCAM|nr:hypothetical protein QYF61_019202 [Mycteria americana]
MRHMKRLTANDKTARREFVPVPSMANSHLLVMGVGVGGRSGYQRAPAHCSDCNGWEDTAAIICKCLCTAFCASHRALPAPGPSPLSGAGAEADALLLCSR